MAMGSEGLGMVVTNSVFIGLAFFAVVMRLYVRKTQRMEFKADDFLIIVSWLMAAGLATSNIVGVPVGGFGIPFPQLSDDKATQFLKILFVQQFWYIFAVAFVKFSVLCFYGRIFTQQGRYPIVVSIFLGLVGAWLVAFFFVTLFQTTASLVFVRRLHLSKTQKVGLTGIFGIGVFCVIASTVRLAYTVIFIQSDPTSDFEADFGPAIVATIMWSGIEASASIICANLPTYWPLIRKLRSFVYLRTSFGSKTSSPGSAPYSDKRKSKGSTPSDGPYQKQSAGKGGKAAEHIVVTEIESDATEVVDKEGQTWSMLENKGYGKRRDVEMGVIRVDTRMSTGSE
ncbi:MAG: hypothetical protein M1822_006684 [Bathelium mastoideum]|nr:MAG: hypothetical protein M1822_006684 [Bathelium mastoideum]